MKKILASLVLAFVLVSQSAFASFSDVSRNDPSFVAIDWMQKNGVVEGYSDGTFRPGQQITRAEFLKIMLETAGIPGQPAMDSGSNADYKDIPLEDWDSWYYPYVNAADGLGIISGYPDRTFRPNSPINYAEALKIVTNVFFDVDTLYAGGGERAFTGCGLEFDGIDSMWGDEWFFKYLYVADNLCILPNYSGYGFDINMDFNRSDMAELSYRAKAVQDYKSSNREYKKYDDTMKPDDLLTFNEFEVGDLKVGLKVGDLTVKSFGPFDADFGAIANDNLKVIFEGETQISGEYRDSSSTLQVGLPTCFTPDIESAAKMPKVVNDDSSQRFCFNNETFAQSKLGIDKTWEQITIKIKNLIYIRAPIEGSNLADLVEVIAQ